MKIIKMRERVSDSVREYQIERIRHTGRERDRKRQIVSETHTH